MASASASAASTDPTSDLATLISKGTVNEEVLQQYKENGLLDIPDKDGRTPLMFACLKGLEDTVKFLLENGANPNSMCLKEGNTPMHYACIVDEPDEEHALFLSLYRPFKWITPKIAITKLLVASGALAIQKNINGWSPPCVAALYLLKDVVDYFLAMDDAELPLEEKIKAIEILGVSRATRVRHWFSCDSPFSSFSQAISLRQGASFPKGRSEKSELAMCFSKISLHECHTEEELESIKESNIALKAHAFMVGDRLFPNDLKQKYLYPSLAGFGCDLMWEVKKLQEGSEVLSCAIAFEHQGESKLGLVLENLAKTAKSYEHKEPDNKYLQYVHDLLCEYESVLNHVHIDSLSECSDSLMETFGEILFYEAFFGTTIDIRSTVQAIEKLVRIIRGRILVENIDRYDALSSVTYKIMNLLGEVLADSLFYITDTRCLQRVKFVICKILCFDNSSYQDKISGDTLLHLAAYSVFFARYLEYLEDLALAFVRHGCPIDVVNNEGQTARDILEQEDIESYPRFLALVSPPTTVLSLEEVALRAIVRHNVIYKGKLPPSLCEKIEGELKDSDLVKGDKESCNDKK